MRRNAKKIILGAAMLGTMLPPMVTLAAGGFVNFPYWPSSSEPLLPCTGIHCTDVCQLVVLLQHVFYFILTLGVLGIAPVMVAVGGLMVLLGGASTSTISAGKSILWGAVVGIFAALISWIVISTVINVMKATGYITGFGSSINCSFTTLSVTPPP